MKNFFDLIFNSIINYTRPRFKFYINNKLIYIASFDEFEISIIVNGMKKNSKTKTNIVTYNFKKTKSFEIKLSDKERK